MTKGGENMKTVEWNGRRDCDLCHRPCTKTLYDARTLFGPWAVMCEKCYTSVGLGLGTGYGRKYKLTDDDRYVKVAG